MEEASCQNILKLLFVFTLPFQEHLCESGQLSFGSWRWYISVHIVDKQWNYKLHVNTKTIDLEQTFPHPFHTWENYERNSLQWFLLHIISYHIIPIMSSNLPSWQWPHAIANIVDQRYCVNMQHYRQNDTFCHPKHCPHTKDASISWSRVYSAANRIL